MEGEKEEEGGWSVAGRKLYSHSCRQMCVLWCADKNAHTHSRTVLAPKDVFGAALHIYLFFWFQLWELFLLLQCSAVLFLLQQDKRPGPWLGGGLVGAQHCSLPADWRQ